LQTTVDISIRIGICFSLFEYDGSSEVGQVLLDQVLVFEEDLLSVQE
jgi:hypothetical protein